MAKNIKSNKSFYSTLHSEENIITNNEGISEDGLKNRITLILLIVLVFIVSLGTIIWVVRNEQNTSDDFVAQEVVKDIYEPQNETQEDYMPIYEDLKQVENDYENVRAFLNDSESTSYGEELK